MKPVLPMRILGGGFDQDHPLAADRLERWPGGRFNHYLFDMNRDWYLQTQKESKERVAAFLHWKPQVSGGESWT